MTEFEGEPPVTRTEYLTALRVLEVFRDDVLSDDIADASLRRNLNDGHYMLELLRNQYDDWGTESVADSKTQLSIEDVVRGTEAEEPYRRGAECVGMEWTEDGLEITWGNDA